jgi:hypothetical protein
MAISNQLARIMAHANAGKQLNAPTEGLQKVVNADGTVTEIPYQEDRFGRRTVMTRQGPQVLQGHEGKDPYGDLGGKIGNVLGGLINKGRLGRQERIAEKSVAEQEMASPTFGAPPVPTNQAELEKARERMSFEMPKEKIDYFDVSTVQSSVKPSALQEKLNFALPEGVSVRGGMYNGVNTRKATKAEINDAFETVRTQNASAGSPTTSFSPSIYANAARFTPDNAGKMKFYGPNGLEIKPDDPNYAAAVEAAVKSGPYLAGATSRAKAEGKANVEGRNDLVEKIQQAETNISSYKDVVDAIADGAKSGAINNMFPTFRDATLKLRAAQRDLGLNVIQNTTFGALSQGELDLAMKSALPDDLSSEALQQHVLDKQAAQYKLLNYYYEALDYLAGGSPNEPPRMIAGFMLMKKKAQKAREENSSGGQGSDNAQPNAANGSNGEIPELEFQSTVDPATKEAFLNAS